MKKNSIRIAARTMLTLTATLYGLSLAGCVTGAVTEQTQQEQITDVCGAITVANGIIQNDANASPTLKSDAALVVSNTATTCSAPGADYTTAEVTALQDALKQLSAPSVQ